MIDLSIGEWNIKSDDVPQSHEHYLELFPAGIGRAASAGAGRGVSTGTESYSFTCYVSINKITGSVNYRPPQDISQRFSQLPELERVKYTHAVDRAYIGGLVKFWISFIFKSESAKANAFGFLQAVLRRTNSIEAVMQAASQLSVSDTEYNLDKELKGLSDNNFPEYTRAEDLLEFYHKVSAWMIGAVVEPEKRASLYVHMKPLSYWNVRPGAEIETHYLNLTRLKRAEILREQLRLTTHDNLAPILSRMQEQHLLVREDEIIIKDNKGRYLAKGDGNVFEFRASPNCSFKFVPVGAHFLIQPNDAAFEIHIYNGGKHTGYLTHEADFFGSGKFYKHSLERKTHNNAERYLFQVEGVTASAVSAMSVALGSTYRLKAETVNGLCGTKFGNFYLLADATVSSLKNTEMDRAVQLSFSLRDPDSALCIDDFVSPQAPAAGAGGNADNGIAQGAIPFFTNVRHPGAGAGAGVRGAGTGVRGAATGVAPPPVTAGSGGDIASRVIADNPLSAHRHDASGYSVLPGQR